MKKLKRTCRDCLQARIEGNRTFCEGGFDHFKVIRATRKTAKSCAGWRSPVGYSYEAQGAV